MDEASLFNQTLAAKRDARPVQETDCRDVDEGEALIQPAAAGLSP
jgi:hypothetical protein